VENLASIAKHVDVVNEMEWICQKDKAIKLGPRSNFDGVNLSMQLFRKNTIKTGEWKGAPDLFRQGWHGTNSYDGGYQGSGAVERLACTNLAYAPIHVMGHAKSLDSMRELIFGADSPDIAQLVAQRCKVLREHKASWQELTDVHDDLKKSNVAMDNEYFPLKKFRLGEIASAMNGSVQEIRKMPEIWRKTCPTPFNMYDLYNFYTAAATHPINALSTYNLMRMRIKGGTMLFHPPNLSATAAPVTYDERKPWTLDS
jgi:hypothetical protein